MADQKAKVLFMQGTRTEYDNSSKSDTSFYKLDDGNVYLGTIRIDTPDNATTSEDGLMSKEDKASLNALPGQINQVDTKATNHINNKSNPHAVTATQVKAVSYESQTLTDAQKTQARANIGAGVPYTYTLPLAANGTRGGLQVGYSTNGKNYAVQLSGEKAYVNVPWTDNDTKYQLSVSDDGVLSLANI